MTATGRSPLPNQVLPETRRANSKQGSIGPQSLRPQALLVLPLAYESSLSPLGGWNRYSQRFVCRNAAPICRKATSKAGYAGQMSFDIFTVDANGGRAGE